VTPNPLPVLEGLPDLDESRVLVRVDFNVPLRATREGRVVVDDHRIRTALPTLRWLLEHGARVTACSHLGRPSGAPDPRWTMEPVRTRLAELCPGVELSENLRFWPGEKGNDPGFVATLVRGMDAYVNEAFGVCHRRDASVVGPPTLLPSAAGRQLVREVEVLGGLLEHPAAPFVAIVGGAKVADKLGVIEQLAERVDVLAIGGGMAFTFLAAQGHDVGASLVDPSRLEACRDLLQRSANILLPVDVVALEPGASYGPVPEDGGSRAESKLVGCEVPEGWVGLDIGPESAECFAQAIRAAATVLWNGPLGVCEDDRFAAGTRRVAEAVAACAGFTVVGGGDSVSALRQMGLAAEVDFLSTGGGASLELLERGDLPGLAALREAPNPAPSLPNQASGASPGAASGPDV
jgi:phosphoglycerate kinase